MISYTNILQNIEKTFVICIPCNTHLLFLFKYCLVDNIVYKYSFS